MIFQTSETTSAAQATRVPKRSEIDPADTWDLTPLFPDDTAWEKGFETLKADYPALLDFKGRVGKSAQELHDTLECEKTLDILLERLFHYASLRKSEDASDNANLDRIGRIRNLHAKITEASAFLPPEIMAIPDDDWRRFLGDPALAEWRGALERIRRFRPHTLGESEERILAMGNEALETAGTSFSQLTNVDMEFGTLDDEKGRERELSQGSFISFLHMRDPEVRRKAFHQFYRQFSGHQFTLASMLAGSVKADVFRARARNHESAIEAALFPDQMPVEVYDNLVSTVRGGLAALHRYYDLRRRALGLGEIHHYDTYVPMVEGNDHRTPWNKAVDLLERALQPLGNEYVETLCGGLRGRWADRYETKGKRSGAFSSSSYGSPPYILMNYKDDVFPEIYTLAHEGGHSMHTWYSQAHQTFQDYNYPIFTAEVASTFNEELLTHHLLATTDDPRMRAYIVNRQIDDIRGTLFRQTMFAEFERAIHEIEERGDSLTLDVFRQAYRPLLDAYFGGSFSIDAELELECLRIPHFYSAFYVYKYATGISAAISLSQRVLEGGPAELNDYLGFLKSGGSRPPLETLQSAGVDMTTPQPIQDAIALFEQRVGELEELLEEIG